MFRFCVYQKKQLPLNHNYTYIMFQTYYNTNKDHILLREYGRIVQKMCDHMQTFEDKAERTRLAYDIIEVMRQVNPTILANAPKDLDTENKLWDDLHIICNFELEIDAPFPAPESDIVGKKPTPIPHKRNKIKLRHYGKHLELLVTEAKQKPAGEEQYQAFAFILRLMKTYYSNWNVDNGQDGNFVADMETLASMNFSNEMREKLLLEGGIIDPDALLHMKQRQERQQQQEKNKNRDRRNQRNTKNISTPQRNNKNSQDNKNKSNDYKFRNNNNNNNNKPKPQ